MLPLVFSLIILTLAIVWAFNHKPTCTRCHTRHMEGSFACIDIELALHLPDEQRIAVHDVDEVATRPSTSTKNTLAA